MWFSFDTELTKYFQFIVPNREPFLDPLVQINNNAHLMKIPHSPNELYDAVEVQRNIIEN